MASRSKLPLPLKATATPCECSITSGSAWNPSAANSAAVTPLRAALPTWKGFVMLSIMVRKPDASEAATPRAERMRSASSPITRAPATAAPKCPSVAVECQPRA